MNRSGIVSQSAEPARPSWFANLTTSTRVDRLLVALLSQIVLLFFTLLILYPVLWMVFASFKTKTEIVTNVWGLPQQLQWQNYVSAWESAKLGYALANSVITSIGAVVLVVLFASLAGFAFAKLRVPGVNIIFLTIVFTMHAP